MEGTEYFNANERTSYKERRKNNFEWYEKKADSIYGYSGVDEKKKRKYEQNFNLYNSRANLSDFNDSSTLMAHGLGDLNSGQVVRHIDIISNIASSMIGDEQKRVFKPMCIDVSDAAVNEYRDTRDKMVKQMIHQKVIQPIIDEVTQQVQQEVMQSAEVDENGQPVISQEQQQQIQQEIEQRVQDITPEYINEYMSKEYKGASTIQGQKILKYLVKELKLKFLFNEGFKNFIITGAPIFYGTIINDKPHVELVDAKNFTYGGANNTNFIEEADWWCYRQEMSLFEVYKRYGKLLTKKDIEKLDSAFNDYVSNASDDNIKEGKLAYEFSLEPESVENIDLLSREGQQEYSRQYVKALGGNNSNASIEHVHCVWKSLTLFKYVERFVDGKEDAFWVDGSYVEGPDDVNIKEVWLPQLHQTTILIYGGERIYINKGTIDEQYDSLENPFDIKGPYFGFEWGKFFGNSEPLAPMDKGKPHQYEYNVVRSKLIHDFATDKGKILLSAYNAKPKDWSIEKWWGHVKDGLMLIDTENTRNVDAQIFKGIDLSMAQDISQRIQYLDYIKQECSFAMQYNPSRMGQVSPYMTATNNQQNIMQSLSQTEDIYSTYNILKENFLTYLIKLAKVSYIKNPKNFLYILDDYSVADIEIDPSSLSTAKFGVYVTNNSEDIDNLIQTKYNMQPMLQGGLINFPEYIKSQWASTGAEILNIAEQAEVRRQQEQQQQQQMQQQQMQAEQEKAKMELEHQMVMFEKNAELQIQLKMIDSLKYANQYDIDKDGMNDNIELEEKRIEHEKSESEKDRKADLLKLREELKTKLEIENLKLKNKSK